MTRNLFQISSGLLILLHIQLKLGKKSLQFAKILCCSKPPHTYVVNPSVRGVFEFVGMPRAASVCCCNALAPLEKHTLYMCKFADAFNALLQTI